MQIINFVFGLAWLLKGEMSIGKSRRVKPRVAKGIGAMILLMTTISIVANFIDHRSILVPLFGIGAPILALVIGLANMENKPN